jgi:hypothetical protein
MRASKYTCSAIVIHYDGHGKDCNGSVAAADRLVVSRRKEGPEC